MRSGATSTEPRVESRSKHVQECAHVTFCLYSPCHPIHIAKGKVESAPRSELSIDPLEEGKKLLLDSLQKVELL